MTRTPEEIAEGNRRYDEQTAKDIVERMTGRQKEFACRAAARWLGRDEDKWQDLVPLLEVLEMARLTENRTRPKTQEEIDAWRNYMMNR